MPTTYDDRMTMLAARQRYFQANGFDDSYGERWVKLKAGPIPIYFPNAEGRRRAVKLHDLHHIATGYQTTWAGEAEIGAWEIASGCGRFAWAWFLNLQALSIGLLIAPGAVFRAFVRGRHSRNLYRQGDLDEAILACPVGEVRDALRLTDSRPATRPADVLCFAAWSLAAIAALVLPLLLVVWWIVA